jgi:Mn-dependent DtxR family transcriptional regulator
MRLRPELQRLLALIAEMTNSNTSEFVRDTAIIDRADRPEHETQKHLNELKSLGMIEIGGSLGVRPTGQEDEKGRRFMMVNITRKGIQELGSEEDDIPR